MGFLIGDILAQERNADDRSLDTKSKSLITKTNYQGEKLILCKPQTFMNLSGTSVQALMKYYQLNLTDLVVIHDDIDIPEQTVKWRFGGSSGGQNGIKDIIQKINSDQFARVKVGIGRPAHPSMNVADYVLSKLPTSYLDQLPTMADEVRVRLNQHFFTS